MAYELDDELMREIEEETSSVGVVPKELMDIVKAQRAKTEAPSRMPMSEPIMDETPASMPELSPSPEMTPAPMPAPAPDRPQLDHQLQEALDQRDAQLKKANQLRLAKRFMESGMRAVDPKFKASMDVAESMEREAQSPIERYKLLQEQIKRKAAGEKEARTEKRAGDVHKMKMSEYQQKLAKMKVDFSDAEALKVVDSPESKAAQERVIEVQKKIGNKVNEDEIKMMSASQLALRYPYLKEDAAEWARNKRTQMQISAQERIAKQKAEAKALADKEKAEAKKQEALDKEKRSKEKEEEKENAAIRKENRKQRSELNSGEEALVKTINELESIKEQFDTYSKKSPGGTGPLATGFGISKYFSEKTEGLDSAFKKTALETMVKMFAGMSKAVDSDAERRAFEATQPNIALDDKTNTQLLNNKINAAKSLLAKTRAAKSNFDKYGSFKPEESRTITSDAPHGEEVTKDGKKYKWNPTRGKYQLIGQ